MSSESISPASVEADEITDGSLAVVEAIERLRIRLIDLTSRNRLLNYRHPRAKSLQVVEVDFDAVFNRLVDGKACVFRPVPEPGPLEYQGSKPEARQHAQDLGINTSAELPIGKRGLPAHPQSARNLRALYFPEDLERALRGIAREARTAIEETGTNMLYLIFGFLEFYDAAHTEKPFNAPLIALPVSLERKKVDRSTGYYEYEIIHNGEDYTENIALREKLRQEFLMQLPELREEDTAESYLIKIEDLIQKRARWRVKRQITLGFLSFGKLAIWAELDPSKWPQLLQHPHIRTIFTGNTSNNDDLEEHQIDDPQNVDSVVYDADASQHGSIIDALAGKSMVINGPPGTGKSQTITNVIAAAMARGKSVLFVSEKLAALELVKSRLEKAGLGRLLFRASQS